jgi:hypothetical protein
MRLLNIFELLKLEICPKAHPRACSKIGSPIRLNSPKAGTSELETNSVPFVTIVDQVNTLKINGTSQYPLEQLLGDLKRMFRIQIFFCIFVSVTGVLLSSYLIHVTHKNQDTIRNIDAKGAHAMPESLNTFRFALHPELAIKWR